MRGVYDLLGVPNRLISDHRKAGSAGPGVTYINLKALIIGYLEFECRTDSRRSDMTLDCAIVDEIESELQNTLRLEVPSVELGDMVLEKLRAIDEISYVRFASVYHQFTDVDSFMDELKKLKRKHAKTKKTQNPDA